MSGGQNKPEGKVTMRRHRLPRTAILRGKKAFTGLFADGKALRGRDFDFKYTVGATGTGSIKVAFVAGKRLGGAVVRNRCKRMLREAYRLSQHLFVDIVRNDGRDVEAAFIAKRPVMELQELVRHMGSVATRFRDQVAAEGSNAV